MLIICVLMACINYVSKLFSIDINNDFFASNCIKTDVEDTSPRDHEISTRLVPRCAEKYKVRGLYIFLMS